MLKDIAVIKLRDISARDDFEYDDVYILKDKEFEENYNKLLALCKTYDNFQEIDDFIYANFMRLPVDVRTIDI